MLNQDATPFSKMSFPSISSIRRNWQWAIVKIGRGKSKILLGRLVRRGVGGMGRGEVC